jgi:hypothetical protein
VEISHGRRQEILISKYVSVKRPYPVTKNPDLMFFGVSAFDSDWLTMNGIVKVLPGLLLGYASDALFTNFLKGPYTDLCKGCSL